MSELLLKKGITMLGEQYISVVIAAAGKGSRMNRNINKQFIKVREKEILAYTIEVFESMKEIDEIIIVTGKDETEIVKEITEKNNYKKIKKIVAGGKERQDSVYNGLKAVKQDSDIVMIHDGARPMIEQRDILKLIKETIVNKACILGVKVKDTIKVVNDKMEIVDTPNRDTLYAVQTPQCFEYSLLLDAYEQGKREKLNVTDDAMMVELTMNSKVYIVEGDYRNIKITTESDLDIFESFLNN